MGTRLKLASKATQPQAVVVLSSQCPHSSALVAMMEAMASVNAARVDSDEMLGVAYNSFSQLAGVDLGHVDSAARCSARLTALSRAYALMTAFYRRQFGGHATPVAGGTFVGQTTVPHAWELRAPGKVARQAPSPTLNGPWDPEFSFDSAIVPRGEFGFRTHSAEHATSPAASESAFHPSTAKTPPHSRRPALTAEPTPELILPNSPAAFVSLLGVRSAYDDAQTACAQSSVASDATFPTGSLGYKRRRRVRTFLGGLGLCSGRLSHLPSSLTSRRLSTRGRVFVEA